MDIYITGIPVRFWDDLREPIGNIVAKYAKEVGAAHGQMHVELFSSYGKRQPLYIVFDRRSRLWPYRWALVGSVADVCVGHARAQKDDLWYLGYMYEQLLQ